MTREVKCGIWKGDEYRFAHIKRDGMWITLLKTPEGVTKAWSRMPRDLTEKLAWHSSFQFFNNIAPPNTIVFCEAYVMDGDREDVKAAMRDEDINLRLECFAIDKVDDVYVPADLHLNDVGDLASALGLPFTPYSEEILGTQPDSEGWVVKDGNLLNWRKVKPSVTYDLRVIGFTEGREGKTGRMLGLVGALIVADASGEEVAKVAGISDVLRREITDHRDLWLGRVIEVEAQGRGKAGGLMHPRFVRLRDDKDTVDAL